MTTLKEIFKDALPIIEKVAPTVAGAIGGPFGIAAGYVIPILSSAFGSDAGHLDKLASNIFADPGAEDKLKNIENQYGNWISGLMMSVNHLADAEINVKLKWQDATKY